MQTIGEHIGDNRTGKVLTFRSRILALCLSSSRILDQKYWVESILDCAHINDGSLDSDNRLKNKGLKNGQGFIASMTALASTLQ